MKTLLKATFLSKIKISHHKEENYLETQDPMPTNVVTHRTISSPQGGKDVCVAHHRRGSQRLSSKSALAYCCSQLRWHHRPQAPRCARILG